MNNIICPVPLQQRPLNEFNDISNSWIISWPLLDKKSFIKKLIFSWLSILPITIIISSGSSYLADNPYICVIVSLTDALILPLLLLIRQWLSWKYIYRRLESINIEYEESGWYDGQIWQKPIEWRNKDLLIAQHEVQPLITHIERYINLCTLLLISGLVLSLSIINL